LVALGFAASYLRAERSRAAYETVTRAMSNRRIAQEKAERALAQRRAGKSDREQRDLLVEDALVEMKGVADMLSEIRAMSESPDLGRVAEQGLAEAELETDRARRLMTDAIEMQRRDGTARSTQFRAAIREAQSLCGSGRHRDEL